MLRSNLCTLALTLLAVAPLGARAAGQPKALPDGAALDDFTPAAVPVGVSNAPTTVVVELAADPVAVVNASAAAPLSKADRESIKARLQTDQMPIENEVRARGGVVLGRFQSAYNGVKVRISAEHAKSLEAVPGVIAVHPVQVFQPDNFHGVPVVGAPAVWAGMPGLHGERVKVGIIDTGIDYTHADFGGPGTPADYEAAHAAETAPASPALFGPAAPKVKGGIDLVGDSYNAASGPTYQPVPHPDANPLDCGGHGSHVAGTVAGFGVLADGSTYTGAYDATTIASHDWLVGPGVAPKADLYAIRVFGCDGSTDMVVDAIDWAVDHDMDVINMSLGSPFGSATDPSAVAADNAAKAGVIVIASAGNAGRNPYITGSPSSGPGAVSVAASDPTASFPGATLAASTGASLTAIDANGAAFADGTTLPVVVLKAGSAISLGCDPAEYVAAGVAGKIVVTRRGTCARVARAVFGQQAGAAAVIMLNNAAGYPVYEGPITGNPDTGEAYPVTIPFLGVPLTAANQAALLAADGGTMTLSNKVIANPGYLATASFSSGGPRTGDSALKPEVTAPGVSIFSVGVGTGNGFAIMSGTSMAAPHTTGVAALVRQAHPGWRRTADLKAAIVNTANPAMVTGYSARMNGAGLVQAPGATATQVVALAKHGSPVLNFGFAELARDFHSVAELELKNLGRKPATFDVSVGYAAGSPHVLTPSRTRVTVRPGEEAELWVALDVPAATAGDSSAFSDVAGLVIFTPVGGSNAGVALRVPYYLVPQAVSKVHTHVSAEKVLTDGVATATTTNHHGVIAGNADWYAWGLTSKRDRTMGSNDLRAVGVQTFPSSSFLAFAISTHKRWSNAAMNEFDIYVDVNDDGAWDYAVVAADYGAVTAGSYNGQVGTFIFTPDGKGSIRYLADAPTDSSTMVLPVLFSQLCKAGWPCVSPTTPITYWAAGFGWDGTTDAITTPAVFDIFNPTISTGMWDTVAPEGSATEPVAIDLARFTSVPSLGFMVVTHDNASVGERNEAQLIGLHDDE